MDQLGPNDQRAAERLAFEMLREAYCDLANVLKLTKPRGASTVFQGLEERVTAKLFRLNAERASLGTHDPMVFAVVDRLCSVLDEAHEPGIVHLAA